MDGWMDAHLDGQMDGSRRSIVAFGQTTAAMIQAMHQPQRHHQRWDLHVSVHLLFRSLPQEEVYLQVLGAVARDMQRCQMVQAWKIIIQQILGKLSLVVLGVLVQMLHQSKRTGSTVCTRMQKKGF